MTSELSNFAAQSRDFIASSAKTGALTDAEFSDRARSLFALQFKFNLPYRKLCEARGVRPDAVTHWTRIPAVPAAAFKEWDLTCLAPEERSAVFHSSGTTEHRPSRHFHSAKSLAVYEASLWPWFHKHLVADLTPDTSHLTLLSPPPTDAPHSSLVHMFDVVRRKLGAPVSAFVSTVAEGAWLLDAHAAMESLQSAQRSGRPVLLLGTAFSFIHLLDELASRNAAVELPPGSRAMETGGYKGRSREIPKAELHAFIERRLGIPRDHIVCEYGMSELSSQAYDHQVRGARGQVSGEARVFRFPPWARVQVVSPETGREVNDGEAGLLRVIDLANVCSVLAIQTEDLAVRRGDGFELIGRAEAAELRGCSLMSVNA